MSAIYGTLSWHNAKPPVLIWADFGALQVAYRGGERVAYITNNKDILFTCYDAADKNLRAYGTKTEAKKYIDKRFGKL